jgi:hypothetical protein
MNIMHQRAEEMDSFMQTIVKNHPKTKLRMYESKINTTTDLVAM